MEPALKELASRGLTVVKFDVEKQKAIAEMHGVRGVPTLKFYNEDKLIRQHTGALSLGQLEVFTNTSKLQALGLTAEN